MSQNQRETNGAPPSGSDDELLHATSTVSDDGDQHATSTVSDDSDQHATSTVSDNGDQHATSTVSAEEEQYETTSDGTDGTQTLTRRFGISRYQRAGLIIVLLSFVIRFWGLSSPSECYFDETYYYYDARQVMTNGVESSFVVHPPVGKMLIAAGLSMFGVDDDDPLSTAIVTEPTSCLDKEGEEPNEPARARERAEAFARRAASALFGSISVLFTYLAAMQLFRKTQYSAILATLILALDGLSITMSRIAMLDIFLQAFVMMGVWALLKDHHRLWDGAPVVTSNHSALTVPKPRRTYLYLTGVFMGLAFATKWTGIMPWGLATLWIWGSEMVRMHRFTGKWNTRFVPIVAKGLVAMLVIPLLVYVLSYASWFAQFEHTSWYERHANDTCVATECSFTENTNYKIASFLDEQRQILNFHLTLQASHSYRAPAYTWLFSYRPVAYYYEDCPADGSKDPCPTIAKGNVAEVIGMGNPLLWWLALIGYPFLFFFAFVRRKWEPGFIVLMLFGQLLPFFASPRTVFLFYMVPMMPFMALSLAWFAQYLATKQRFFWIGTLMAVLSIAGIMVWGPVYFGWEIPRTWWEATMWFNSWI